MSAVVTVGLFIDSFIASRQFVRRNFSTIFYQIFIKNFINKLIFIYRLHIYIQIISP